MMSTDVTRKTKLIAAFVPFVLAESRVIREIDNWRTQEMFRQGMSCRKNER